MTNKKAKAPKKFDPESVVISSNGLEKGRVVGEVDEGDCGVESCRGTIYIVRWPDGELTHCCSSGLKYTAKGMRIL